MAYSTLPVSVSVSLTKTTLDNALNAWQNWSDATFDDKYREAILTLIGGVTTLVGYLTGFACCWLALQLTKTARYWLTEAVQAVPVLNGWWSAPFVEIQPTQYPEICWQALAEPLQGRIAPETDEDILDYELSWAETAEPLR